MTVKLTCTEDLSDSVKVPEFSLGFPDEISLSRSTGFQIGDYIYPRNLLACTIVTFLLDCKFVPY